MATGCDCVGTDHVRVDLAGGEDEAGFGIVDRRAEIHAEHAAAAIDQWSTRIALSYSASDRVHLAYYGRRPVDVGTVELDDLANPRRVGDERPPVGISQYHGIGARGCGVMNEFQWRRLKSGHIQDGDIGHGVEGHDGGVVFFAVHRDGEGVPSGHHVSVGHHPVRCDDKAAALEDLLA